MRHSNNNTLRLCVTRLKDTILENHSINIKIIPRNTKHNHKGTVAHHTPALLLSAVHPVTSEHHSPSEAPDSIMELLIHNKTSNVLPFLLLVHVSPQRSCASQTPGCQCQL